MDCEPAVRPEACWLNQVASFECFVGAAAMSLLVVWNEKRRGKDGARAKKKD